MYTMENYVWGLVGYALGAGLVLWYAIWLLRHIHYRYVRHLLIILCIAVLFTPVMAYPDRPPFLAPAMMVAFFEGSIYETDQGVWRALTPIIVVFLTLVLGYAGYQWWRQHKVGSATP